jgi:hypothetical protein
VSPPRSAHADCCYHAPPYPSSAPDTAPHRDATTPPYSRSPELCCCSRSCHRPQAAHPSSHLVRHQQLETKPRRPLQPGRAPAESPSGRSHRPHPLAELSPMLPSSSHCRLLLPAPPSISSMSRRLQSRPPPMQTQSRQFSLGVRSLMTSESASLRRSSAINPTLVRPHCVSPMCR